jgi:heme/copper-type cytochrome/quinol oxidase subunit 4
MSPGVPRRTTVVWLVLVGLTVASFWVGTGHLPAGGTQSSAAAVVGAAFVKAHLVGRHFMEVRDAPAPLRWVFGAWTGLFGTLCVALLLV